MTFLDLRGRKKVLKNFRRYLIDWNKKTRSKFQDAAKAFLYPYWRSDILLEEMPLVGSRMTYDFVNISKSICLEVSGRQHIEFVKHFHGTRNKFLGQIKRDLKKQEWCDLNGYTLVEIYSEKELSYEYFLSLGVTL